MQNERTVAEREGAIDSAILGMLVNSDQRLWSRDEIEHEIGRDVTDSLNRLYGGGLIHRLQGFAWPTRAALMSDEIGS